MQAQIQCSQCGTMNPSGKVFCSSCGNALMKSPNAGQGSGASTLGAQTVAFPPPPAPPTPAPQAIYNPGQP